ncbi:MAG: pseudouridine synthase [Rhodospirillaceae bacterium]
MSGSVRIDKLLANLGYGSRNEVHALARRGEIVLDGVPLKDASARISLARDLPGRITVAGQPLDPLPGLTLMVNKPLGVTCSHKEAGALVYDLLPPRWRRRDPAISAVGRLDKETSGLLLMTDDGALLHQIISPRRNVTKHYLATLARPLRGDEAALFASGSLMLEGETEPLAPAVLEPLSPTSARVIVTEGRYHQVRRMFAAAGNHVEALHRERIGALMLPADIEPGSYRVMSTDEITAVFA